MSSWVLYKKLKKIFDIETILLPDLARILDTHQHKKTAKLQKISPK